MSEQAAKVEPSTDPAAPTGTGPLWRLLRFLGALRAWAYGHWLRGVIVAGTILSLIALTMAGWAYLANVALQTGELSLDAALAALDEGRYEEARAGVGRMLKNGLLPRSEFGGPLYVLGAIKIVDAENQPRADRRRIEYLVASRYLKEARAFGIPETRAADGLYLLGKSLIESGQFDEGFETLDELLSGKLPGDDQLKAKAQSLLADSCLSMPNPKLDKALSYILILSSNPNLSTAERAKVLLQRGECLSRLERFEEARETVATIPANPNALAGAALMRGKIELDEIGALLERIAPADHKELLNASMPRIADAMNNLRKAQELDEAKTPITRQSSYHLGRGLKWQGDADAALKQFARTRQLYDESFEGLAAALAEADMLRENGDIEGAVLGYRRVLESFAAIPVYRSHVLPLAEVREHVTAALKDLVERQHFAEALTLLDRFPPLFSRAEQLELRGGTLEQWGNLLVSQTSDEPGTHDKHREQGLHHLRAAGVAFEQLAELRFATKFYSADLWHGAENFFRGHSFSRTVSLLNEFLKYEPELRNAEALLRLGQAYLAIEDFPKSIAAFEECIEFHPFDGSAYQARIDCAKAYWHRGDTKRAEQLLRDNIAGSSLKPTSPEWKDSLFVLGMLLHETGQHEEAIGTLEEAIERYPQDPQQLVAQYEIGESYRRWAKELLDSAEQARTTGEREKRKQLAIDKFNTALKHFEDVQVSITFKTHDIRSDPLMGSMLRNCYMLEATVLFDLGKYKEAIEAFSNVASLNPEDPFVLETFVQIANCWRRQGKLDKARGAVQQAQIALEGLPADADFTATTALNREEWRLLLADMSKW
ncbi:MAG: tetratricopeptide repeat protein [Planctomycetes bacterium]|nr:tetratricopeptide repeat protein [Planctomycetota bacterium]